jgi:pyochelin biosynthetic protein PchG
MSELPEDWRPRVVVCGTKFGRIYLAAFREPDFPFELAGILARGSERSKACAKHYGVPLFTDPSQLPDAIDIACVVVSAGINGGRGAELAQTLMGRGIHILQEHPLHHDELAECLRQAHRQRVVYHLNTHYVHIKPVRRFINAARRLFCHQRPLFVDAAGGFQTAFTLFDILGKALGSIHPWAIADPLPLSDKIRKLSNVENPFRSLEGVIAGVPLTLRIQNQLDPADPDNYAHFYHRVTFGTEGGDITLINTHGPVIWCPRPHLPADSKEAVAIELSPAHHLTFPSAAPLGPAEAPSYCEILSSVWPAGVSRALLQLRRAIIEREDSRQRGQYYLTLCQLWHEVARRLGCVTLVRGVTPNVLPAYGLTGADDFGEEEHEKN